MTSRAGRLRYDRGFRRFWSTCTISDFGTSVTTVALGVIIVSDLGATAADVGLVQGAAVAPYLVVGLFAGVLADRVRRRPLLVGTDLGRAVVLAGVPLLATVGALTVPLLAALMAVFGLLSVLSAAAQQSLPTAAGVPRTASEGECANRTEHSCGADRRPTDGRQAGGRDRGAGGDPGRRRELRVVRAADRGHPINEPGARPVNRSVLADLREGARWVYRHPTLRSLALSTHVWFLFNAAAATSYVPYALRELGFGPAALGVTFALAGIGALLGTSASEFLSHRVGIAVTVVGSRALEAGGFAVIAVAGGWSTSRPW